MKQTLMYAALVAVISSCFIFFQFSETPKGLANDEVDFIHLALGLENAPYHPYTPEATGHTTLYFYVVLFFFKVFGLTQFALRFPSAISGVIAAVLFYLVAKEVFKQKSLHISIPFIKKCTVEFAFVAALILLSMRWYFQFARFSFEATFLLMFEMLALYAALLFRRSQSLVFVILAALASGLAYNSYTPGRIFFVLIAGIIFFASRNKKLHLGAFLATFGLSIAPLTTYLMQNQDVRIEQQLYLKNPDLTLFEKATFFLQNLWKNIFMLFGEGDVNGRHNYPYKNALNPILYSFFGLGLVRYFKEKKTFFDVLFFWYLLIGLLPTLLTYPHENPNMLRTFTVLPSLAYFMTKGILLVERQVRKDTRKQQIVGLILVFLLLISIIYEARTYFVFQKLVYIQAFDLMQVFENLAK